jgi:DNA-dependent protein kinase catalytic subunit
MTCITTLEKWFNALPVSLVAQLYADVLPKLSDFLQIESGHDTKGKETYFFQDLIKETKEERVDRREIANKVLDLLGKIGGHAHSIINNELTKKHDRENFIRWDSEKRLKFSLPLHSQKIDIYLDSCLPRIIDLAQNSSEKRTRIAACELLHGLVLYMIGKSATRPKGTLNTKKESEDMAAFAKLYAKLFPVIIRLATEIE